MKGQTVGQDSVVARHSFVVRIWREEGSAGWRGWVQHTRSGESTTSQDLDELLAFVERRTGKLGGTMEKGLK
jgi:hypothetical protein